jgi:hypothetical protein
MATLELRPMGIGDILDTTFRLYRQRFLTFLLIALIVYVPYAFLIALIQPAGTPETPASHLQQQEVVYQRDAQPPSAMAANPAVAVTGIIGIVIFAIVLLPLCSAALVHNISATYLGENLTAGQSYARAAPRLLGLLWTMILSMLTIWLGILLLIVPGIIFSLWFLLITPVVILECKSGSKAMGRSRELMRGNLNKGFVLGLTVWVFGFLFGLALGTLTSWAPLPHPAVRLFLNTVLQAIILPIQTAPWILLYYDLRIRKEAFDLQKLTEALGQATAT